MNTSAIFTRRSVRIFKDQAVETEKVERLLRAAMQAPSAKNRQPWEFLVVTDEADRKAVAGMSVYTPFCADAPLLIITMADTTKSGRDRGFFPQDLSAATQNILLQAVEEGLGACWCGFYPDEKRYTAVQKHFELPEHIVPFSVIAVGYGEQENRFIDRYQPERVHYGKW